MKNGFLDIIGVSIDGEEREVSPAEKRFCELSVKYRKHFDENVWTEPIMTSYEQMNALLERCLAEGRPIEYYHPMDPNSVY